MQISLIGLFAWIGLPKILYSDHREEKLNLSDLTGLVKFHRHTYLNHVAALPILKSLSVFKETAVASEQSPSSSAKVSFQCAFGDTSGFVETNG